MLSSLGDLPTTEPYSGRSHSFPNTHPLQLQPLNTLTVTLQDKISHHKTSVKDLHSALCSQYQSVDPSWKYPAIFSLVILNSRYSIIFSSFKLLVNWRRLTVNVFMN